ncbi:MAG TPA: hypothetical protein DCL48_06655 [Alphaproteobacteria bacterium]|nr:hypothetical protein [Alphaproteobacteria bacterium]
MGGPGASRYRWNPPGPVGGPGRGAYWAYRAPVRAYYGYPRYAYPRGHLCRYDRDNNPPGPRGGRGTNWENPPGWRGGPGASPNSPFRPC